MQLVNLLLASFPLQLALTGAPASSHIYVFTDAMAKDIALKDTIISLIRTTKSTVICTYTPNDNVSIFLVQSWNPPIWSLQVSIFFTGGSKRKRRALMASYSDYEELALASGGQAIQVSKGQLPEATKVILDTSTSALVKPYSFRCHTKCSFG